VQKVWGIYTIIHNECITSQKYLHTFERAQNILLSQYTTLCTEMQAFFSTIMQKSPPENAGTGWLTCRNNAFVQPFNFCQQAFS
jgi:hypothetical protein